MTKLNNDLKMSELRDIGYAAIELADVLIASHADDVLLVAAILVQRRLMRGKPLKGSIAESVAAVAERTAAQKQSERPAPAEGAAK